MSFPEMTSSSGYPEPDDKEPLMYLVPAARQLLKEITDLTGKGEVLKEPDGIGFYRSVRLTPATGKLLGDAVLEALAEDSRVAEVVKSSKGVRVTFVSTTAADYAEPFGLASVV